MSRIELLHIDLTVSGRTVRSLHGALLDTCLDFPSMATSIGMQTGARCNNCDTRPVKQLTGPDMDS